MCVRGICPPFSVCCNVVVVDQSRVFETKCGLQSKPKPQKQFKCSSSWWFLDLSSYRFITADFHSDLGELVEPEEEPKGQRPTTTPPSTPVRAEEGRLVWLTWHTRLALFSLGLSSPLVGFLGFSTEGMRRLLPVHVPVCLGVCSCCGL